MAKRKTTKVTVETTTTIAAQGDTTVLEQPIVETAEAVIAPEIQPIVDIDLAVETTNIIEGALKLYGQGRPTAEYLTNMIIGLETNRTTTVEEKIDAYAQLIHNSLSVIEKLGYDTKAVMDEFDVSTETDSKNRRIKKADYSKAKAK